MINNLNKVMFKVKRDMSLNKNITIVASGKTLNNMLSNVFNLVKYLGFK